MRENVKIAIDFVLKSEGGYIFDPDDPGGETNYGIAKRYHPNEDIKNMTEMRAAQIYKNEYWDAVEADNIPFPLDIITTDTAVNCGKESALRLLGKSQTWEEYLFQRVIYYSERVNDNPKKLKFFFGWLYRILDLRRLILDEQKRRKK